MKSCSGFAYIFLNYLSSTDTKTEFGDASLRVVIEARVVTGDDEVEALGVTTGLKQSTVSGLLADIPCNYSAEIVKRNTRRSNV